MRPRVLQLSQRARHLLQPIEPRVVEHDRWFGSLWRYVWPDSQFAAAAESMVSESPLAALPRSLKQEILSEAVKDDFLSRCVGSMVGMAVGDSVGARFEFLPAVDIAGSSGYFFDRESLAFTNEHNVFGLELGQWTDDTSMGLCLADSLLGCQEYDGVDVRRRFWCWWHLGYCNGLRFDMHGRRHSVGLGGGVAESLRDIPNHPRMPTPRFEASEWARTTGENAGNGSLMRLCPVPMFFSDLEEAVTHSRESSLTTHPGPLAEECCGFLGFMIWKALHVGRASRSMNVKGFLTTNVAEYLDRMEMQPGRQEDFVCLLRGEGNAGGRACWNWKSGQLPIEAALQARGERFQGHPVQREYFGSFSLDALAVVLHCIYHTSSFAEALARCVNLLGDADPTGAIVGQLAGALYGYEQIDTRLVRCLEKFDHGEVGVRAVLLAVPHSADVDEGLFEESSKCVSDYPNSVYPPPTDKLQI